MKRGDIVVCVTKKLYGAITEDKLQIGEHYKIEEVMPLSDKKLLLVNYVSSGVYCGFFDTNHFIPLDDWREFQLKKVLDDV